MQDYPIQIYDTNVNFIEEIDNYESLVFERKLYKAGKFTLVVSSDNSKIQYLIKNNFIVIGDDNEKVGIIREVRYKEEGNIKTTTIIGFELKRILRTRITTPTTSASHQSFSSTPAETIIKTVVKRNCFDIAADKYDNLIFDTDQARGGNFDFSTRYKNLSDEMDALGRSASLGYKIYLDPVAKKFNFEVIEGEDRTTGLNPVTFSLDFDNIKNLLYIDSLIDTATNATVAGQGDGAARTIVEVGSVAAQFERSVIFVDARDINSTDDLTARGNEKLAKQKPIQSFDCSIFDQSFLYQIDYDLGDVVNVEYTNTLINIDIAEELKIEGITEYYDVKGFNFDIMFGNQPKVYSEKLEDKTERAVN